MLPPAIKAHLDTKLEGVSRRELAARARRISEHYRQGQGSSTIIRDDLDALAYVIARMPATYAAIAQALFRTAPHLSDFAPASLLDLGAGPGSATFAALDVWPSIATIRQVERSSVFRRFASELLKTSQREGEVLDGDLARGAADGLRADVVIAGYVLVELADRDVARLADQALQSSTGLVVFVEPGTPEGFARIRLARQHLIGAGARIVAPCPGNGPCPMTASDWCHFSARLARSRDHMLLKDAEVPFEDERYAYVAATQALSASPAAGRVLRAPAVGRSEVQLVMCTPSGLADRHVARRDNPRFKLARKLKWGDVSDH